MTDYAVPETPATMALQREELINGVRHVMVYKGGSLTPPPKGFAERTIGPDVYHYNPAIHTPESIQHAITTDTLGQHLRLGDTTKNEAVRRAWAGETPIVVVERTPSGVEVRAAAGTIKTAPSQMAYFNATKARGNAVRTESPQEVIMSRKGSI